ncbi:MAG: divalent-cation tolerance protein CutA [Desulfobacterales bacterium]|nr:MAG: divalent-cation tolerance protein CutA [Desulfobacterales bacterium]
MQINFVYMTAGNKEEAQEIGKALVASRLAACVNIIAPMHSIYRWEGAIQEDTEVVLIAKTTEDQFPQLVEKVKSLHTYDCPCIVSLPVKDGNPAYLDWIVAETE